MERKAVLGLDLDGVIYPYHQAFYDFYCNEFGYEGGLKQFWNEEWNTYSTEKQDYLVSLHIPYEVIVPSKKVQSFMEDVVDLEYEAYYITSRDESLRLITERYLRRYDFPFRDNLIFTKNKDIACVSLGVTHFIDDFASQVKKVGKVCNAFLMSAIHNESDREEVPTVYSLEEFLTKVGETV